jgi:hypothetical protein
LALFADEIPEGEPAALRDATNGEFALGSDRFQRQIAAMVGAPNPANPADRRKRRPSAIS